LLLLASAQAAFVSYSRVDSEFVMRLAGDLKAAGANVWLDQLDIPPGERWDRAVEGALEGSPLMLAVLSSAAIDSMNVMDEVAFALEKRKTVIPIMIEDCAVPFRLRRIQHIDFRRDYARGLRTLLTHLGVQVPEGAISQTSEAPSVMPADTKAEQELRERLEREEAERGAKEEAERQGREAEQRRAREEMEAQQKAAAEREAREEAERKAREKAAHIAREQEETRLKAEGSGQYWAQATSAAPERSKLRAMFTIRKAVVAAGAVVVAVLLTFAWVYYGRVANAAKLRQACDGGDAQACVDLGYLYDSGTGVLKNYATAAGLYQKSCDGGNSYGCIDLGMDYAEGWGVSKDAGKAAVLYEKSCDGGNTAACEDLAEQYESGDGVGQDINRAKQIYQKACSMGSGPSCDKLKDPKFQ
jgi:TPR repeat protein